MEHIDEDGEWEECHSNNNTKNTIVCANEELAIQECMAYYMRAILRMLIGGDNAGITRGRLEKEDLDMAIKLYNKLLEKMKVYDGGGYWCIYEDTSRYREVEVVDDENNSGAAQ